MLSTMLIDYDKIHSCSLVYFLGKVHSKRSPESISKWVVLDSYATDKTNGERENRTKFNWIGMLQATIADIIAARLRIHRNTIQQLRKRSVRPGVTKRRLDVL